MNFPPILKEIHKYELTLDNQNETGFNDKTYNLIYKIEEFTKLNNQNENYIDNLRKNGVKLKHLRKKVNKKVHVVYYAPYSASYKSNKYIDKRVEGILNKEISVDGKKYTNQEYLNVIATKDIPKNKKSPIQNKGIIAFEIISSYLCRKVGSDISVEFKVEDDHIPYDDVEKINSNKSKKRSYRKNSGKDFEKWKNKNRRQYKKWESTKPKKIKDIRSKYLPDVGEYEAQWVYVDADNKFKINDCLLNISHKAKEYKTFGDNQSKMDMVLAYCISNTGEYYFFDENIREITDYVEDI